MNGIKHAIQLSAFPLAYSGVGGGGGGGGEWWKRKELCDNTWSSLVQSLNSPFFPSFIGAEPGRAKRESSLTCMRMLRTPKSGEKPYLEVHSGQTTEHSREHARELSTSGQFPSSSHKIPRSTSATRAISVLSSIILRVQTFFSRVLLLRQQPFSSENLPQRDQRQLSR